MKYIVIMLTIISLLIITACENKVDQAEMEKGEPAIKVDLATYIENIEFPTNLSLGFESQDVKEFEKAKEYQASFYKFDTDRVIEELLHGDVVSVEDWATGRYYEAVSTSMKEFLQIYGEGEKLVDDFVNVGGLRYMVFEKEGVNREKIWDVVSNEPGPGEMYTFQTKSNYSSYEDLAFLPFQDALSEVENTLATLGFPDMEVSEAYSLDVENMQKHYDWNAEHLRTNDIEPIEFTFSKEDEAYLFFFRQVIDEIPVIDVIWQEGTRGAGEVTETPTSAIFSKEGLIELDSIGLYNLEGSSDLYELLGASAALDILLADYSRKIMLQETIIDSMELCYVGVVEHPNYKLIPAWVFVIQEAREVEEEFAAISLPHSYSYYVINAITGERIMKAGTN
ncbi:hypothetical protein [Bacillus alkalicellulosilyticus]|uniref:hypothetical protein n=1 Tax=Alkalihalobacterium alkalicellulosilyticum TaxID=1912214 RepID=UPI0009967942|nr:hypothetical protein [Bacillus alkalicellulosilyticus]